LLARDRDALKNLSLDEIVPLLMDSEFVDFVSTSWLEANLPNMSSGHITTLLKGLALAGQTLDSATLEVMAGRVGGADSFSSAAEIADFAASVLVVSGFRSIAASHLLQALTVKSTPDSATIKLCQLIAGHVRLGGFPIDDATLRFLKWIDSHLLSRYQQPLEYDEHREWYVPNGAVTDLSVFPVNIPLALPDPRIDLNKLHQCRTATAVRRTLAEPDCGVALVFRKPPSLTAVLEEEYLRRLGWTVNMVEAGSDITDPNFVSLSLMSDQSANFDSPVRYARLATS
jgi:hypothetical protein